MNALHGLIAAHGLACFFGGAFLCNAIPHMVAGVMGEPFQTPFAKPSGVGLSSATVNVTWGFANLVIAYVLLACVSEFSLNAGGDVIAAGLGIFAMALFAARTFGRLHGGDLKPPGGTAQPEQERA